MDSTPSDMLPKEETVLSAGAALSQDFKPLKNVCAHLNAFHAYANDPKRAVEANHYCGHLSDDVRQCIIYDSPEPNARIIGIEYMITPEKYETLPPQERRLWHSHVYEVKSGMLVMPNRLVPQAPWELAEKREMEKVVTLYGKTYHLWQTDRGDELPLGEPQLMTSYIADGQLDWKAVEERDERFGVDSGKKREGRRDIGEPRVHEDADYAWKKGGQ
ncbi:Oil body-associated protein 1A [Trichoderma ghanense]|uniref:Oil body-associated protein 1A n=1 Tax=Trichoderma ghanense TaxID=65468 RepID=A0ABY2GUS8_9HYPO